MVFRANLVRISTEALESYTRGGHNILFYIRAAGQNAPKYWVILIMK